VKTAVLLAGNINASKEKVGAIHMSGIDPGFADAQSGIADFPSPNLKLRRAQSSSDHPLSDAPLIAGVSDSRASRP